MTIRCQLFLDPFGSVVGYNSLTHIDLGDDDGVPHRAPLGFCQQMQELLVARQELVSTSIHQVEHMPQEAMGTVDPGSLTIENSTVGRIVLGLRVIFFQCRPAELGFLMVFDGFWWFLFCNLILQKVARIICLFTLAGPVANSRWSLHFLQEPWPNPECLPKVL